MRTEKQEALNVYMPKAKAGQTKPIIRAPMSGKLVSISVRRGDHVCTDSRLWFDRLVSLPSFSLAQVKEGSTVAVLEAMKMQNPLKASRSGIVKAVHVTVRPFCA